MTQKNVALVPLFACALLLIMGALDRYPQLAPPSADASFVAQPVAVSAEVESLTAGQTLAQAAAVLTVALLTAVLNLVMMALTAQVSGLGPLVFGQDGLTFGLAVKVLGLLLLFALFFSAVLLAV